MIRVALLGHGFLGKWHAQKLYSNSDIIFAAIVEPFKDAHPAIQQLYPNLKIVSDLKSVIHEIDAAIIATPTSTHSELVKLLLENKKHIFCEKPLAHDFKAAQELYLLSQKYPSQVTQVGHSERCHQIFETEKNNLNLLSKNGYCVFERYGAFKGRATDVSCVEDIMVHDLDLMMYLFEPELISCSAYGIKSKTKNWDTVHAVFKTNETQFNFFVSRDAVEEKRQMACYGPQGTMVIDFMQNSLVSTMDGLTSSKYEKRDHLLFEQTSFFKSINQHTPSFVNFNEGMKACYLVEIVLQALNEQKTINVKSLS